MAPPSNRVWVGTWLALVLAGCGSSGAKVKDGGGDALAGQDEAAGSSGGADASDDAASDGSNDAGADGSADVVSVQPLTNTSGLTLLRDDLGARKVVAQPSAALIRIDRDPLTGDIVVMSTEGKFWKLDPQAGTVTPTETSYAFAGIHQGMTFDSSGALYTAAMIVAGTVWSATIRKGTPGASGRTWTTMATTAPYAMGGTGYDRGFSALAVDPGGQFLYVTSGGRTDHGEVQAGVREQPLTTKVFKLPLDASNVILPNDAAKLTASGYVFADGLANAFDLAFTASGDLIATETGPEMDLPDELNWIEAGKHYGFPWQFSDQPNPVINGTYTPDGDLRLHDEYPSVKAGTWVYDRTFPFAPPVPFAMPIANAGPDADKYRPGKTGAVQDASDMQIALPGITGHRTPLGLSIDAAGALCGDYNKAAFLLSYGATLDVFGDPGRDLLLVHLTKTDPIGYQMTAVRLASGFTSPVDGVLVGDRLYVISHAMDQPIYEIDLPGCPK